MYTTQKALRKAFWADNPQLSRKRQSDGDYVTDTRVTWIEWLDALARSGQVSHALAYRATLD